MKRFSFSQAGGRKRIVSEKGGGLRAEIQAVKSNLKQHYNFTLFADIADDNEDDDGGHYKLHKLKAREKREIER